MKISLKGRLVALLLAGMMIPGLAGSLQAQEKSEPLKLKVGDMAPDFKLQYFDGHNLKDVRLSDYRGKANVVVAFYVFAFTGG